MTIAPLQQAALPTARAIRWAPFLGVSGLLLVVLLLARSADGPVDVVLALASAALARSAPLQGLVPRPFR